MSMKTTLMIVAMAAVLMPLAASAQASSEAAQADRLELKGLGIGDPKERVLEVFPDMTCTSPADGLERCTTANTTYADEPAEAQVLFVDGTVLEVKLTKINSSTLIDTVRPSLIRRLGEPATSRRFEDVRRQNFFWNRGNSQLHGDPMDRRAGEEWLGKMFLLDLVRGGEWARRTDPAYIPKVETNDL
jgi:hypothetical protein